MRVSAAPTLAEEAGAVVASGTVVIASTDAAGEA
jgi:hypothetical protein